MDGENDDLAGDNDQHSVQLNDVNTPRGYIMCGSIFCEERFTPVLLSKGFGAKVLSSIPCQPNSNLSFLKQNSINNPPEPDSKKYFETSDDLTENLQIGEIDDDDVEEEPLLLLDEEAFYLVCNNMLHVYTPDGILLNWRDIWNIFCSKKSSFPVYYSAYRFFREKKYVVKGGINFGVDFSVYRTVPSWCHSEMCVIVVDCVQEKDLSMSWRHVSSLTRVMPVR